MVKAAYIEARCKLTYSFEDLNSSKELIDKVSQNRSNQLQYNLILVKRGLLNNTQQLKQHKIFKHINSGYLERKVGKISNNCQILLSKFSSGIHDKYSLVKRNQSMDTQLFHNATWNFVMQVHLTANVDPEGLDLGDVLGSTSIRSLTNRICRTRTFCVR